MTLEMVKIRYPSGTKVHWGYERNYVLFGRERNHFASMCNRVPDWHEGVQADPGETVTCSSCSRMRQVNVR